MQGLPGAAPLPPEAMMDPSMMPPDAGMGGMGLPPELAMGPPVGAAGGFASTDPMQIAQLVAQVFEQMANADHAALDAQGQQALAEAQPLVQALLGGGAAPPAPPTDPMLGYGEGALPPADPEMGY